MTDRSLEQSQEFHLVKRIASVVAPAWTVLATPNVEVEKVLVDHKHKRIEVGEENEKFVAVALALWGVAHARLDTLGFCPEFCGKINQSSYVVPLINRLSAMGEEADLAALEWTEKATELVFPHAAEKMRPVLREMVMGSEAWHKYFDNLG